MARLESELRRVEEDHGNVVVLAGEAGIGKSRIIEEMSELARQRGFRVLAGACYSENQTPYLAFFEAFQSGDLAHLLSGEPVRLEAVYLAESRGLLLGKAERRGSRLDADVFTSMLKVVESFVQDTSARMRGQGTARGRLHVIGMRDYRIVLETGHRFMLVAVLSGKENEFLLHDMRVLMDRIEGQYGAVMENWDHTLDAFQGLESMLQGLLTKRRYVRADPARGDPEMRRNRLFQNLALGLARESRERPILLCVDDLHWAEPSTLAMFHYVARNTRDARMLILAAYRPEEVATSTGLHPVVDTLRTMEREGLVTEIPVRRLDLEPARSLLLEVLDLPELQSPLADRLLETAGGNPLFLLELAYVARDENLLRARADVPSPEIPTRIYNVVARRLARLEPAQRNVLEFASVFGGAFDPVLIAEGLEQRMLPLMRTLRDLETVHRLVRTHDSGYRFDQPAIKEVIYRELPEALRREYHKLAATAIEAAHADDLEFNYKAMSDVAYHQYQARNPQGGVQYCLKAALAARNQYANEEAIRFLTWSLELMGSDPSWDERPVALETRGDLHEVLGRYEESILDYMDTIGTTEDPETVARLYRKIGGLHQKRGRYREATAALDSAEDSMGDLLTPERGIIELWRGRVAMGLADYDAAVAAFLKAREILEACPGRDEADVAESLYSEGMALWTRGDVLGARERFRTSLEMYERLDDLKGMRPVLNNLANTYAAEEDYSTALELYGRSVEVAERIGDEWAMTKALTNIGQIRRLHKDFQAAEETFRKVLKIQTHVGDFNGLASIHRNLAELEFERGRLPEAEEYYRKSLEIAEMIGDRLSHAAALRGLGDVCLTGERREEGLNLLRRALAAFDAIGDWEDVVLTRHRIAGTHLADGRRQDAAEEAKRSVATAREWGLRRLLPRSILLEATILNEMNEHDAAERLLREAETEVGDTELPDDLGRIYLEHLRALRGLGRDREFREVAGLASSLVEGLRDEELRERIVAETEFPPGG